MNLVKFEDVLAIAKTYLDDEELKSLNKAYIFAKDAHMGQKRTSGEAYIHHPLAVTKTLTLLRTSLNTLLAGLLHDVVEDCDFSLEDISKEFGKDVAKLVDGVTKLDALTNRTKTQLSLMNVKKVLLFGVNDIRILIIKLADRLHNISTLAGVPKEKQQRIAKETLEIYCPIALKLSLYDIKRELEIAAFPYAFEKENRIITKESAWIMDNSADILKEVKKEIFKIAKEENLEIQVFSRLKTNYAIYRKLYIKGRAWEKITDLLAVRVIVPKVEDCYKALWMFHKLFKPVPGRFKDYIAMPKPNSYQSIHTAVVSKGFVFEAQIRTKAMDIKASVGIAGDWKYKEISDVKIQKELERSNPWIKDVRNFRTKNDVHFFEDLISNISVSKIYVIDPNSKVYIMPKGSSVLDFAYKVHTDFGNYFESAVVNSRIVGFSHKLRNGSAVKIIRSNKLQVKKEWLDFVKTRHAKDIISKKVNRIKKAEKEKYKKIGELKMTKAFTIEEIEKLNFLRIAGFFQLEIKNKEDLMEMVGRELIKNTQYHILNKLTHQKNTGASKEEFKLSLAVTVEEKLQTERIVLSKCCSPIPGDFIKAILVDDLVRVHIDTCQNLLDGKNVNVHWNQSEVSDEDSYKVHIEVISNKETTVINETISKMIQRKINVLKVSQLPIKQKSKQRIRYLILVDNVIELEQLISTLESLENIITVNRLIV